MANLLEKASIILTPTAYDDGKVLAIKPSEAPYGDFDFTRNSSATRVNAQGLVEDVQILSSNLVQNGDFSQIGSEEVTNGSFSQEGSELITNGDFATDSNWAKNPNWTISGGTANCDGTSDGSFFQGSVIQDSKQYLVTYTISNLTQGGLRVQLSGTQGVLRTLNGTYTEYITSGLNPSGRVSFECSSSPIGSIDNVSVKEVGQDWELQNGWSIGNNVAVFSGTASAYRKLYQENILTIGKTYKLTFDIVSISSGSIKNFSQSNPTSYSTIGTKTEYFTATFDDLFLEPTTDADCSITNISVKEVGENWSFNSDYWSVVEGSANFLDVATAGLIQNISFVSGKTYNISFEINSGSASIGFYSSNAATNYIPYAVYEVGTHSVSFNYTTGANLNILGNKFAGTAFNITNISLIEITDDTNLPRINYSGFTYQDSLGSELILNGDFSNGENNWDFGSSSWILVNSVAESISTASGFLLQFNVVDLSVKEYKLTYEIITTNNGALRLAGGNSAFGTVTIPSTVGVHTVYLQSNGTTRNLQFWNATTFIGSIDNVSVKEYLGQEVVPDSGCGAWLFEPQSTNIITQSEDFSQWIIQDSATVSSATFVSPSGENNASLIDLSANTDSRVVLNFGNSSTEYTFSVYLKKHESDSNGTFPLAYYDGSNYIKTYVNLTDKWERFNLTFTNPSGSTFGYGLSRKGTTNDETLTRCYAWGGQFEAQSYATSYIPTEGTIKTRNQDICTNGGDVSLINSSEGVLYLEASGLANGVNKGISISSGNLNNSVNIFYLANNNTIRALIFSGSSSQASIDVALDITSNHKIAIKYSLNDVALWIDGLEVGTDTNALTPIGMNTLNFSQPNGADPFFGNTKALGVWKEALTDAELRSLTYPTPTAATFDLDFNTIATDFTFTRNSEATFVNAQGLIQSTNEIGAEEITNGDFEDGSTDWILSGLTTIGNGVASFVDDGTNTNSAITQTNVISINKTYKITFDVVRHVLGGIQVRVGGATAVTNELLQGVGSYTMYINSGPTSGSTSFQIKRWGGLVGWDFDIDNVSVKEYITETNTPRLDYSTGAEAFLLEPQRTNLIPYSEDFTVWNQIQNVNLISNSTISPSGENNATKFLSTTGSSKVRNNFSSVSGTTYTFSVYCKNIDATFVRLLAYDGANEFSAYVVSQINTSTWTKVSLTFTAANTSNSAQVQIARDLPDGQSLYFWGAQLEGSSYATSYIPTSGTTVTRNQELCNNATPVINSEEGVLYAEIAALSNDVTNRAISISDGTTSNVVRFYYSTTDNRIVGNVKSEGITSFTFNNVLSNATNFLKIAISYKLNNFKMYVNGIEVASDTVGNAPIGLSELSFDNGVGNDKFFGNTKGLKIYPKALADVELQDLTTI